MEAVVIMASPASDAEAELEAFRQRWREEVSARSKKPEHTSDRSRNEPREQKRKEQLPTSSAAGSLTTIRRRDPAEQSEDVEPQAYHDLPDKEEHLRLGAEGQDHDRTPSSEPSSALEHYEHAVERETQGQLGDSIKHYRKAFRVRPFSSVGKQFHFRILCAEVSGSSMTACTKPTSANTSLHLPSPSRNRLLPTRTHPTHPSPYPTPPTTPYTVVVALVSRPRRSRN